MACGPKSAFGQQPVSGLGNEKWAGRDRHPHGGRVLKADKKNQTEAPRLAWRRPRWLGDAGERGGEGSVAEKQAAAVFAFKNGWAIVLLVYCWSLSPDGGISCVEHQPPGRRGATSHSTNDEAQPTVTSH